MGAVEQYLCVLYFWTGITELVGLGDGCTDTVATARSIIGLLLLSLSCTLSTAATSLLPASIWIKEWQCVVGSVWCISGDFFFLLFLARFLSANRR